MNMHEHGRLCAFLATASPLKPDPDKTVAMAGLVRRSIGRLRREALTDAQVVRVLDKLYDATELLWDYDSIPEAGDAGMLSPSVLVAYHHDLAGVVVDFSIRVRQ